MPLSRLFSLSVSEARSVVGNESRRRVGVIHRMVIVKSQMEGKKREERRDDINLR